MSFLDIIHRTLYGKDPDPLSEDNKQSEEFLAGYDSGMKATGETKWDARVAEWKRRGRPEPEDESWPAFREWKRGFNAGILQQTYLSVIDRPARETEREGL